MSGKQGLLGPQDFLCIFFFLAPCALVSFSPFAGIELQLVAGAGEGWRESLNFMLL